MDYTTLQSQVATVLNSYSTVEQSAYNPDLSQYATVTQLTAFENSISVLVSSLTGTSTAGVTGTGNLVYSNNPVLVAPTLGAASASSINKLTITAPTNGSTLTIADGKVVTISNTITFQGTDSTTFTLPSSSGTLALNNQPFYIGTTSVAINRSSGSLALTGVSIDGNAGTVTNGFYTSSSFNLGTTSITVNRSSASQTLTGISIDGNAGTVTNGVYTTGSYANPSWITSLSDSKVLPAQANNTGKYLTTDGTSTSWVSPASIGFPSLTGNIGKYLTNDGVNVVWGSISSTASGITFTPTGNVASTNVQAAIAELDTKKAPLASPTFTGTVSGITATMVGLSNVENTKLSTWAGSANLTTVGALTSGSIGTGFTAIPNSALANSSFYVGTTSISLGRASASQTLTGVSIDGNAGTVTNGFYTSSSFNLGTTSIAVNRSSASQTLTGVSIDGNAGTVTNGFYTSSSFNLGTTSIAVNRSSASQTLTGVSIDGNAGTVTTLTPNQTSTVFALPDTSGSAGYLFLGTWTTSQNGAKLHARLHIGTGYNATITQNAFYDVYFKTSNGSSTQAGSTGVFYGDGTVWRSGPASALSSLLVIQLSSTSYALYAYCASFTGASHYEISIGTGSWANSATNSTSAPVGNNISLPIYTYYDSNNTVSSNIQIQSLGVGAAASGTTGEIRATNNITAYYSDDNLKTRLGNIENALEKVRSLEGFYYEANETAQALGYKPVREVGLSAQSTQKVMPEIVKPAPIDDNYLTVQYERYTPFIVEAIKELADQIDDIKKHLGM